MNTRHRHDGFTLVELLIGLAIVGAMAAMVYGTLLAVIRSTQAAQDTLEQSQQVRSLVSGLWGQVASLYPSTDAVGLQAPAVSGPLVSNRIVPAGPTEVLRYDPQDPEGVFLRLLTTAGVGDSQDVWQVDYRYDPGQKIVLVRQRPFRYTSEPAAESGDAWRELCRNVQDIELAFLTERSSRNTWDSRRDGLPRAVRLDLTLQAPSRRSQCYSTILPVGADGGQANAILAGGPR
ncbi:MAG: prepilin-type N-terminal cleavage/methylation domain-containing protein [Sedimentisphaerales bacterium]|nr:prepilin-type N-terminal cleavage/methylation domain-containing protein [Sedimentisphaerales bacterium]